MKSYFSRFLHRILSHSGTKRVSTPSLSLSDVNPQSTPMLSYSGLTRISRWKKFANWFDLDTPVKPECDTMGTNALSKPDNDSLCTGRSMVEMLGVLAIIGVLSVGAIAGYSKAMMKYKLNQHAQAVNLLINNSLSIKDKLQYIPNGSTLYGTLFYKMNLLPDGIKYISNGNLEDIWFKGKIVIYYANDKYISNGVEGQNNFGGINFKFSPSSQGAEICRNIALAAKENAADLYSIFMQKKFNDTNKDVERQGKLYGDAYCTSQQNCLRYLDLNKIDNMCNNCNEKGCTVYVIWKQT